MIITLNVKLNPIQKVRVYTKQGVDWGGLSSWVMTTDEVLIVYSQYAGARPERFLLEDVTDLEIRYDHTQEEITND